mmetsp:Transcript_32736/g.64863  ORF Transcript_32736/g.64863 Transcript_32736/m.64863 type:complete len:187 (-) Transcript_32736:187-747(-)|eukprot:CAMPEP_0194315300 /NCGR_PEP_ID=MMETSP0171-20130528/12098_1 /TAXON_ID=218684 /ORGANISM="Corethron pennatum, Strain L29A3" /LENGTH=186 /DNA_ID=CAMNT_0039071057 /DNA_START=40 /DNA_END=600 /DNA_ORIENTATION=-
MKHLPGVALLFSIVLSAVRWTNASDEAYLSINAITLATDDMQKSCNFYAALGMTQTYGGGSSDFSTFTFGPSSEGPGRPLGHGSGRGRSHLNLFTVDAAALPPRTAPSGWNGWGRAVLYVADVDAVYALALSRGLRPEMAPVDADWGERYFHLLDPAGHEISFAAPLPETDTGRREDVYTVREGRQ